MSFFKLFDKDTSWDLLIKSEFSRSSLRNLMYCSEIRFNPDRNNLYFEESSLEKPFFCFLLKSFI